MHNGSPPLSKGFTAIRDTSSAVYIFLKSRLETSDTSDTDIPWLAVHRDQWETDRQVGRQADRQANRQTDRQTHARTHIHTHTHTLKHKKSFIIQSGRDAVRSEWNNVVMMLRVH